MSTPTRRTLLISTASTTLVLACQDGGSESGGSDTDGDGQDTERGADTDSVLPPSDCPPTADDIEGPFWVEGVPVRNDLDLHGDPGPRLTFDGIVQSQATCEPLAGAVVEIWHADPDGAYDGDADGKYRGQTRTGSDGTYSFTTVLPGRYLNGGTFRPAHIHAKVWVDGTELLTTQLYFAGDPYNDEDPWFDPDRVVADLEDGDTLVGAFDFAV